MNLGAGTSHNGLFAQTTKHRQGHTTDEAAGGGLVGIKIAMSIIPDQRKIRGLALETGNYTDTGGTISFDDYREISFSANRSYFICQACGRSSFSDDLREQLEEG